MDANFTIYHTCHLENSINSTFENSPYKCSPDVPQWLGDGYYFWTDSDFFAHKWGKRPDKYPKGYVITQYSVNLPQNSFLDLVGNVKDQLLFKEQIKKYLERMGEELSRENARAIPISKVLDHLRLAKGGCRDYFKYDAIKAMDCSSIETFSYKFTEEESQKELIPIPTRQQLFLRNLSFLKSKQLICIKRLENDFSGRKKVYINKYFNKEEYIVEYKGN